MKTYVCTLTERGQISIPADSRAERGLKPGDKLPWSASDDKALLVTTVETTKRKSFKSAMLMQRIAKPHLPAHRVILEAPLVVRASTTPPKKAKPA